MSARRPSVARYAALFRAVHAVNPLEEAKMARRIRSRLLDGVQDRELDTTYGKARVDSVRALLTPEERALRTRELGTGSFQRARPYRKRAAGGDP